MFFEAMDLHRTLDLNSNPICSSHFESNFKQTKICPATRANMNEPSILRGLTGVLNNGEVIMRTSHSLLRY